MRNQPGSLLKPFIYATAMQSGDLIPSTPILDEPTSFERYAPSNYQNAYHGWTNASYALSRSLNVPAVSVLERVGVEKAFASIKRSGINLDERDKNLALALGGTTYGSTCAEICAGYMTLASMGTHRNLTFIRKITDSSGKLLYLRNNKTNAVFDKETAYLTTTMLAECAQNGTAKQLSTFPFDVAAKTGTVAAKTGNAAAWCAGYTTRHTFVCQYSAQPQACLPNNVTGGNLPTKSIRCALKTIYQDKTPAPFRKPNGIKTLTIDRTIKEEMHKLVPYEAQRYGSPEMIEATEGYRPDSIDPDELFFGDLSISSHGNDLLISCKQLDGIEYAAKINGVTCTRTPYGFFVPKQPFPLARLEITCSKTGKPIYYRSKIIKTGQSLINSRESRASQINFS
ncbi:MAG: hypothetical protein IJT91_09170 [Clostridia bacterium]|nr:hypothetical protein [Clostridia bacterium]